MISVEFIFECASLKYTYVHTYICILKTRVTPAFVVFAKLHVNYIILQKVAEIGPDFNHVRNLFQAFPGAWFKKCFAKRDRNWSFPLPCPKSICDFSHRLLQKRIGIGTSLDRH